MIENLPSGNYLDADKCYDFEWKCGVLSWDQKPCPDEQKPDPPNKRVTITNFPPVKVKPTCRWEVKTMRPKAANHFLSYNPDWEPFGITNEREGESFNVGRGYTADRRYYHTDNNVYYRDYIWLRRQVCE